MLGHTGSTLLYGGQSLILNSAVDYELFSNLSVSGSSSLTQAGTGNITLTYNSTNVSGTTFINSGSRLFFGNGSASGSLAGGAGSIVNNGTLTINRSNDLTVSYDIGGTGLIVKQGSNILTLSSNMSGNTNTNMFTGNISVAQGTVNATMALPNTTVNVGDGATFNVSNATQAIVGTLIGSSNATINVDKTLTVGGLNTSSTFAGLLKGSGTLNKSGTGTFTLSGDNSGFSGNITVSNGTLVASSNNALGNTVGNTNVATNATLDIQNANVGAEPLLLATNATLKTSTGDSTLGGTVNLSGAVFVNVSANAKLTLSGNINGNNPAYNLSKTGAGSLYLSGDNSNYTGSLNVTAGVLAFDSANALARLPTSRRKAFCSRPPMPQRPTWAMARCFPHRPHHHQQCQVGPHGVQSHHGRWQHQHQRHKQLSQTVCRRRLVAVGQYFGHRQSDCG